MARGLVEFGRGGGGGGAKWFSYKRITIAVCCLNLIAALFVLRSIYTSFGSVSNNSSIAVGKYTEDQIRSIEESIRVRLAAKPVELINLVRKLKDELRGEEKGWEFSNLVKQKMANELLERLKGLKADANETELQVAVESWSVEKLEEIKRRTVVDLTSDIPEQEATMLERALESDRLRLLEDIGFWMPANVNNIEVDDKPENATEFEEEEEIIAGRPLPPECHAELHTDYDGTAVRWGLTHHKESAADCCQACLDHAKRAKPGEKKCNIWVYCPSEYGCYSPDMYEHKHQECWLKQAENPRLNFKAKYSESYRNSHPTAPVIVPWMSGVVSA